jgi:hypothetical protein
LEDFCPLGDRIPFPASDFQELIRLNKFRELQGKHKVTRVFRAWIFSNFREAASPTQVTRRQGKRRGATG